jgi:hypothetical protein
LELFEEGNRTAIEQSRSLFSLVIHKNHDVYSILHKGLQNDVVDGANATFAFTWNCTRERSTSSEFRHSVITCRNIMIRWHFFDGPFLFSHKIKFPLTTDTQLQDAFSSVFTD